MLLSSSLFLFCAVTIVQSRQFDDEMLIKIDVDRKPVNAYAKCTKNESTQVQELKRASKCIARDKLVTLEASRSGVTIWPRQILLKRCDRDHISQPNHACVAVSRSKRTVLLKGIFPELRTQQKCLSIEVEEHVECKSECQLTEKDCSESGQKFSKSNCSCFCDQESENRQSCEAAGKEWSRDNCSCTCKNESICSTNFKWSEEDCRCKPQSNAGK